MFANAKALLVIVSCALVAQAQSASGTATATSPASPTSTGGLDPCILNCVTQNLSVGNCSSPTDLPCVCTSTAFQQAVEACLKANCPPADLQTAAALQQQECAALGSGSSSAVASTGTSSPSQAGASASGSATPSASKTNAAMALTAPLSLGGFFGTLIASAGALVGAAFVL